MHVSRNVLGVSRTLSLVAAIIAVCIGPAVAQTYGRTTQTTPAQTQLSAADRAFVTNMLQISRAEIAMATYVELHTNDPAAAVSAAQRAAQWAAFRAHLAPIAAAAGEPAAVPLTPAQQAMVEQVQSAPKSKVMPVLVNLQKRGDELALDQMRAASSSRNPEISAFIAYARPAIAGDEHTMTAENWNGATRTGAFSFQGLSKQ